jgi:hypothetical protein
VRYLSHVAAVLALVFVGGPVLADVSSDEIDKLYGMMRQPYQPSDMGDNLGPVHLELHKNIPASEHADTIAELIERGIQSPENDDVILNALVLAQYIPIPPSWTARLEDAVRAATHSRKENNRRVAIELLFKHPGVRHREEIVPEIWAILSGDDERIRSDLLSDLTRSKWPEVRQICEKYIRDNKVDPKHHESVLVAREYTDTEDVQRLVKLFADDSKPHELQVYLSYAAEHRGQDGYDFSVSKVEEYAKQMQQNLDFDRKQAEFKKTVAAVRANADMQAKFGDIEAVDLDDWGSNRGINGEMTWGEYGDYQLVIRGSKLSGTVRASWHYNHYQFELTKIGEIAPDYSVRELWPLAKK